MEDDDWDISPTEIPSMEIIEEEEEELWTGLYLPDGSMIFKKSTKHKIGFLQF